MNDPIENSDRDPGDAPDPAAQAGDPATPAPHVVVRIDEVIPERLVALPLNQRPMFPTMVLPLVIPAGKLSEAVRLAIERSHGWVGFFLTRELIEDGSACTASQLYRVGCAARIIKHQEKEDGGIQVLIQVIARWRMTSVERDTMPIVVRGEAVRTPVDPMDTQVRALAMAIVSQLRQLVTHNPVFGEEIKMVLANFNNIEGPGRLADIAASLTTARREELQEVLETFEIVPRMERVVALLAREEQLTQLKTKIQKQIEEKVSEHQRKFFLHEQLKAIKQELGLESDDKTLDMQRLRQSLERRGAAVPEEVREVAEEELRKLALLDPASSEYNVVRTRLEWLTELPWGVYSEDVLDVASVRRGLDADHYGLEDVKQRIVEFVAVRQVKRDRGGGIVALVGPPGTGKTSIGASIARHIGRRFFRFSLGGMRDEAEIKGHRRTYVGALPGKIVQALRRCGTMNPVILLDEIDKLGHGPQGDPAAALLEVLDPEQNKDFLDHYLDVRIDLSQVLFICTANDLSGIPEPLRDRMEVIRLSGYVDSEKLAIAKHYLVPKQLAAHGLARRDLMFTAPALSQMIRDYAREAGVRHLDQLIAKICRKVATARAEGRRDAVRMTPARLVEYLGKPLLRDDELLAHPRPGVVTGLAWTALGGATLEVEAVAIPAEKGGLTLTGQLGDVMKESATLARSYLMAHAARFALDPAFFDRHLVHVHVPAGATPKDGPSAGITIATALLSLARQRAPRPRLGMTGELTLTGRVYPVGGIREKIVAARRSGLERVLLPLANERDWAELPRYVTEGIAVTFVATLDEVLLHAGVIDA
ncbi:MAG: endopeptidase La [Planctomycetota bacterium]|nr:endopeptidase La [Planctomycetota bacterium]MDW8373445.1 endopeptidase La [Planctomycetota bacterium]